MKGVSVIVSTYNQPHLLRRCLLALGQQSYENYEVLVADDGSGDDTRNLIQRHARDCGHPVKHIWHEDDGFRKTVILNKSVVAASGDYLIFIDGDCVTHHDFISEHVLQARPGHYLNGSLIRLGKALSDRITEEAIIGGQAFRPAWLMRQGRGFNRRYLRLALPYRLRQGLNQHTRTKLYWLGSNSSCFKADAVAVNGFDHRFTYGLEDADFGYRLELSGVKPRTVRWTAVVLHLWHGRPWSNPDDLATNRKLADETLASGRSRAVIGLEELPHPGDDRPRSA
jgi:glycosyltransferase involved in cell wall biosynthesis